MARKLLKIGFIIVVLIISLLTSMKAMRRVEFQEETGSNGNYIIAKVSFLGYKLSQGELNENGLYDGPYKAWHMFTDVLRQDGQFSKGYWHGTWKEFDRQGNLKMIREWDHGTLVRLFQVDGNRTVEMPKDSWPPYVDPNQRRPENEKLPGGS